MVIQQKGKTMKEINHLLTALERKLIAEDVAKAESTTSGEIVVLIVGRSKHPLHLHMSKKQAVHKRAEQEFMKLGIQQTKDRTGVLIMVSVKERMVVVKADRDIDLKVSEGTWDEVVGIITRNMRAGQAYRGLSLGVQRAGRVLAQHFPPKAGHTNQLPNEVVEKE